MGAASAPSSLPTVRVFLEGTRAEKKAKTAQASTDVHSAAVNDTKVLDFVVDDADASQCVILEVGDAHFRLQRDKLCAHSAAIRGVLSESSARSRSFSQGSQHSKISDVSDSGYESGADCSSRKSRNCEDVTGWKVVIEGVDAADFEEMLKAMEDAVSYVLHPPPAHTLACVLRAAHALACSDLVQFTSALLQEAWSSDLHHVSDDPERPISDAREAIILARELGIPGVLKRALYELLRGSEDWYGGDHEHQHELGEGLCPADQRRLHTAHGELQMAWAGLVWTMPNNRAFQCHASPEGSDANTWSYPCVARTDHDRFQTWRELLEESELFTPHDPLDSLRRLAEMDWAAHGYCADCATARREAFSRKREELWHKLDTWFDL